VEAVQDRTFLEEHQDALAVHRLDPVLGAKPDSGGGGGPQLHPDAANACGGRLTNNDLRLAGRDDDEEAAHRLGELPQIRIAPDSLDGLGLGMNGEDPVAVGRQLTQGGVPELLTAARDPDDGEVFLCKKVVNCRS